MELELVAQLVSTLGFPIVCVGAMGWFIYQVFQKTTNQSQMNMDKVQERCKEREEKLYDEIKANREVNAKAIATIAHYAEKLDTIQEDVKDIKKDLTILTAKSE